MTKDEMAVFMRAIAAIEKMEASFTKMVETFNGQIPQIQFLAGAISDLGDVIGSDPTRALKNLQLIKTYLPKSLKGKVIKEVARRFRATR